MHPVYMDKEYFWGNTNAKETTAFLQSLDHSELHGLMLSEFYVLWKYVLSMLVLERKIEKTLFQTSKSRRYDLGSVSYHREEHSEGLWKLPDKCGCVLSDARKWVLQKTSCVSCG